MVACFAGAWLTSESERWRLLHVTLGYTMVGLVLFRLLWGVLGLGAAYALSPRSQLKGEWTHTRIGRRSVMADDPPGEPLSNTGVNVLSLSYSVVF